MNSETILQPFKRSDGSEFEFQLIPEEIRDDVPRSDIFYAITDAGGLVYSTEKLGCSRKSVLTVLNTLHYLQNPTEDVKVPHDTFCFSFIYEYLKALTENLPLPNAYIYMLTPSKYEPYDPYTILRGEQTWEDLTPLKNPPSLWTAQEIVSNLRRLYNECSGRAAINVIESIRRIEIEQRPPPPPPQQQQTNSSNSTVLDNLELEQSRQNSLEALPERLEELTLQRKSRRSMSSNSPDTLLRTPPNSSIKSIALLARSHRLATANTEQNKEDSESESDTTDNDNNGDATLPTPSTPSDLDNSDEEEEDLDNQMEDEDSDRNELARDSDLENETSRTTRKRNATNEVVRKGDSPTSPLTTSRNSSRVVKSTIKLVPVALAGPSNSKRKKTTGNKSDVDINDGWISYDGSSDSSDHDLVQESSSNSRRSSDRKMASKPGVMKRRRRHDSDNSSPPRDQPPRSRVYRKFTLEEGQRILDIICNQELFRYTGGNLLWRKIEKSKHFKSPQRTFQSLKEHFKKVVLPNALEGKTYKISDINLKKLKQFNKNRIEDHRGRSRYCPRDLRIE